MSEDNIMLDLKDNLLKRIDEQSKLLEIYEEDRNLHELLSDCRAEIERLSKPYVPMTDYDAFELTKKLMGEGHGYVNGDRICAIETAVIKRLGLEIKHD